MHDTIVIGGGIAGLTAAWSLRNAGKDVVVLEEQTRAGGNVYTVEADGYRMESGPHSFMGSSENLWNLVEAAGLEERVEPAADVAANRFIYRDGRLVPLPLSATSFLSSRILSFRGKCRLAMEPFVRNGAREDDTAWDFFVRRFGVEAASYIMSPFISGIYAGDIRQLGARAAFPKFWRFEKESGSMIRGALGYLRAKRKRLKAEGKAVRKGLFSFTGGLGSLTGFLASDLAGSVRTGLAVSALQTVPRGFSVRHAQGETSGRTVVLAAPPHRAAGLLPPDLSDASALLRTIPMAPVALVHWSVRRERLAMPEGFGFLVPRGQGVRVLGTLFPSQLFSGRAPDGLQLMASYYGGMLDPEAASLPDRELAALVAREHNVVLGADPGIPEMVRIMRYSHAIPQLTPDHQERIAAARAAVGRTKGLVLAGNYLTGVGIEHAVESGLAAAGDTLHHLEA